MSEYPADLLNYALELATEWGENFHKPINERLTTKFPGLSDTQITEITDIVRAADYKIYASPNANSPARSQRATLRASLAKRYPGSTTTTHSASKPSACTTPVAKSCPHRFDQTPIFR
ncbi:MAG: hypothetical protein H0V76_05965 [Blastocatellia bacterium]|nr:hypothetical protein [Blastocatellia bacterium]